MKIKKSQLERLIKLATLDILKELESRAQEADVDETSNPPSPPIGAPMIEGKRQRNREKEYNKSLDKQTATAERGDNEGSKQEHNSRENKAAKDRARHNKTK